MSAITPFNFNEHAVRVQLDDNGQPWFNARDVCEALEYGNPRQALASHVDSEDVQNLDGLAPDGKIRQLTHLNESGVYALILGSKKPAAKAFKRWVTSEVLPSIRKTGSYTAPAAQPTHVPVPSPMHDKVSALLLIGQAMNNVPGVKAGIAMAATLDCISQNTGLVTETLRLALPAANEPICSLNATALGERIGQSAKATNKLLAAAGFQFRNARDEWELTEAGKTWAEAMPFVRNGHSGYQILWNPQVADRLIAVA